MSHRSDYLNIHEQAYKRLRRDGKSSWSKTADFSERADFFSSILSKYFPNNLSKLLVLGCGDGEAAIALGKLGHEVTGIDISPTAIQWAKEKSQSQNARVTFRQQNIVESLGTDSYFDAVVDDHCLHCIIGDDRKLVLENIFSSLADHGILIVRTQCGDPPEFADSNFLKMWDPISRCQVHNGIAGRYFGLPEDIIKEIQVVGFCVVEQRALKCPNEWEMLEVVARKK